MVELTRSSRDITSDMTQDLSTTSSPCWSELNVSPLLKLLIPQGCLGTLNTWSQADYNQGALQYLNSIMAHLDGDRDREREMD